MITTYTPPPALRHFNYDRVVMMETDALDYVSAGVLS